MRRKGSQARTVYLPNEEWEASKELAKKEGIPHSQLVGKALRLYLQRDWERKASYAHRLASGFYD